MRPRPRLVARLAAAAALVLLLVALLAGVAVHERLPRDDLAVTEPGALQVEPGAVGVHEVGEHRLLVDEEGVRIEGPGGVVWGAPADTAFLVAASGEVTWREHRGYFWPTVEHDRTWPDQRIDEVTRDGATVRMTGELTGGQGAVDYEVRVVERAQGGVTVDVTTEADGGSVDAVRWAGARSDGAGVHGFGEQFDEFDLSGRLVPIVVREQGVGRGEQPLTFLADLTNHGAGGARAMTYAAWPSYVTDDLQGLRLAPDDPASYSFAVADTRQPREVALEVWSPRIRMQLTRGDDPVDLLTTQQAGTDRPRLAPWTQRGALVGIQGGADRVRRVVDDLERAGAAVAGVWLQDWSGQRTTDFGDRLWWTWQLDEERYPGWRRLVAELRDRGIRTTTYVNPWLVDASEKARPPARNLWEEAREAGLLVEHPDGGPYLVDQGGFDASLVDLTDPAGRDWMADVIADEVLADGVEGFMADFGEGLPMDAVLHDGAAERAHNAWPRLWARTVRAGCERAGKPDCVTWFRAGTLGMDAHTPAFWNGDQVVTWSGEDGLHSALLGTFHAGVSGWPVVHADVGGYTSVDAVVRDYVRDEELLARWGEYAALGPLLRSHEGNRPGANRQVYDPDEVEVFARNSRLYAALAPYRRGLLDEAARTGLPVVRHTWLHHPGEGTDNDRQFLLGDAVVVAPVLDPGRTEVDVDLPPGQWTHLPTGETRGGGRTVSVAAPVGTPAAFIASDHPMADRMVARVRQALR